MTFADRLNMMTKEELTEEELLVLRNIKGGIWATKPVDEQPDIQLIKWWVFSVPSLSGEGVDHHFNGYNPQNYEGRVSSKIMEFDMETKIGKTRSGRSYQLQGQPSYDGDAFYVYRNWLAMNKFTESDASDATGDYLTLEQKQEIKPGYTE